MTLIEVVAGLALLASLLTGVLLAKARHTRQLALAQRRIAAIAAADRLMGSWWAAPSGIPRDAQGDVPDETRLSWRTTVVPNEEARRLNAAVVRLEVLDTRPEPGAWPVLVAVEVAVDDAPVQVGPPKGGQWQ